MIKEDTQSQPVNSAHMYERHTMTTPETHIHVPIYMQTYYPSFISATMIVKNTTWGRKLFSDYSSRLPSIIVGESRQKIKQQATTYQQSTLLNNKCALDYFHTCLLSTSFLLFIVFKIHVLGMILPIMDWFFIYKLTVKSVPRDVTIV